MRTLFPSVALPLAAAVLAGLPASSVAQLPPKAAAAPAVQAAPPAKLLDEAAAAKLLAQLEEVNRSMEEKKYGYNSGIIRDLRDAGSSGDKAFGLWLDCMKLLEFEERGRSGADFSEWKRNQTKSANNERDASLQLQVQWLTVVVMDANARTPSARAEVVSSAVAYIDNLLAFMKKNDGKGVPGGDVIGSVFGRRYKLDVTVGRQEGGATRDPGDIGGIYESVIFPYYRENRMASSLMQAWTKRIAQETEAAAAPGFREAEEKFVAERLPRLRWGQMRELFALGQQETAAASMLAHIKTNMAHREAGNWIEELRNLLANDSKPAATPAKAPAAAVTPAPAETPAAPAETNGEVADPFGGIGEPVPVPEPAPEAEAPAAAKPATPAAGGRPAPGTRPGPAFPAPDSRAPKR